MHYWKINCIKKGRAVFGRRKGDFYLKEKSIHTN